MNRLKILDWNKWTNNTLTFLSPLATLYLLSVVANVQSDGFQVADFAPSEVVIGAMMLYVLNTALDFFKKFSATKQ